MRTIIQLTPIMKVTGPMKLQIKWLSTLSQHLQGAKGDIQFIKSSHCQNKVVYHRSGLRGSRLDDGPQLQNRDSSDHREENPTLGECWPCATRSCSLKGSGCWTHDFTVCKCPQMCDVWLCVPKTLNSKQCNEDSLRMMGFFFKSQSVFITRKTEMNRRL